VRGRLRRLAFGLATVVGAPRGFFIPHRHAAGVRPGPYPALEPSFRAAHASIEAVLEAIEAHAGDLAAVPERGPARFDQDWFPRLDAAAAYALVRRERPARIVEVGSGHSTRFLAQAVRDSGLATEILCIDPAPRAALAGLPVRHEPRLLQDVGHDPFEALGPGDILFVDSSHVAMPGSDVDRIFLDVLPRLAGGVLVHVHDVFLPDSYPPEWAWRGYGEQLLVGALLQGRGYEVVFPSRYAATRLPDRLAAGVLARLPLVPGALETSLWLRKL
jgi:predicted O-methyltransferase YrrM